MSAPVDEALRLARLGLRVLPLHTPGDAGSCSCSRRASCTSSGKHPRTRNGVNDATRDPSQIMQWWGSWPEANVGVATGNGLAVLDVDPRSGGHETLAAFVENVGGGVEPTTAEVATGGNGRHLYFRAPAELASAVLGAGLDLKAAGGYVVAPPSLHASGRVYTWHPARALTGPDDVSDLPAWVLDATGHRRGSATPPAEWARLVNGGAPLGERNNATARLAGHLLARGVDPHVTLGLLVAWDAKRNRPPLGEAEVTKTVASIVRREARKLAGGAA